MLDKKVKQAIIQSLKSAEEFYIPVKKLWKDLRVQGHDLPELEEFEQDLKKDKCFEFTKPRENKFDKEDEKEMEEAGFYSGARIKLRARKITKEDFQRILLKHAQNVTDNLVKAYQAKPTDLLDEKEDELIELMKMSKKFKDDIDETLSRKK